MRQLSLTQLYEDNREKLLLNWMSAHHADRSIEIKGSNNYGADVVGHINIIHPERLQVMGLAEYEWAMRIGERLLGMGLISRDQLAIALREQEKSKKLLGAILVSLNFITESALGEVLAESAGAEKFNPQATMLDTSLLSQVPRR